MGNAGAIQAGAAYVKLTVDNAALEKGLQKAQNKIQSFARSIETVGERLAVFGTFATMPIALATRTFAEFDDKMRLVSAATNATGEDFAALSEQAKKLGRETSFSAAQVAEGMTALGRMGFSPKQIQASIEPMMNLARATGTDLATAAEISANAMRALGIDTSKAADVADILMTTANGSAQSLTDLGEALKMAAPAARTAGETITDVNAALGVLANVGIKGSMAGNALKRAYSELAKTGVQDYLKQYGIHAVDATGNLRKMADVLKDCAVAMAQMGSAEKMNFATQVFGERAAPAALAITVDTTKIDDFRKKLESCKGAAQLTADQMESGLGGALRLVNSGIESISISVGEVLSKSLIPLAKSFQTTAKGVAEWISENSFLVTSLAAVTAGTAAIGISIKAVALAGRGLAAAFSPLAKVLATFDAIASGSKKAEAAQQASAAAVAAAEKQKELAATTSAANQAAADAKLHLQKMSNAATEAAAVVTAEKTKLAAMVQNQGIAAEQIAESAKKIAAIQAEAAAQVAAERQKIAAITATGAASKQQILESAQKIAAIQAEAAAAVAAENTKKVAAETTAAALQQQVVAQQGTVAAATAAAAALQKQAAAAENTFAAAAQGAKNAAAAENTFAAAQAATNALSKDQVAAIKGITTWKGILSLNSKTTAAIIAKTNLATIVSEMRLTAATGTSTVALYAKAIAAKVAAGALVTLQAVMTAIAAHPVTLALIALAAVLGTVYYMTNRANAGFREMAEKAKKASDAAAEAVNKGDTNRQNADVNFERLKQLEELSRRGRLTAEEMAECERLMKSLAPYGAAHFAQLDKVTGQLKLAADAQNQFNEAMKLAARLQIQAEINELKAEQKAIKAENERLQGYWNHTNFAVITGQSDAAIRQIEVNGTRAVAVMEKINAAQLRLKAMQAGDWDAVTGKTNEGQTQQNVDEYKRRQAASVQELANAEKELGRIEEENAKRKRSALENEIAGIQKVRDEYRKNAEMLLASEKAELAAAQRRAETNAGQKTPEQKAAFEAAQKAAEAHAAKIRDLERRIAEAEASFNNQIASAQAKEAQRRQKANAPFENFLANQNKAAQQRGQDKATDAQFEKLQMDSSEAGKAAMQAFINAQNVALEMAKREYTTMLERAKQADSEGGADLSENERSNLSEMQRNITDRMQRLENYRDRIGNGVQEAQNQIKTISTFDAGSIAGMFGKKSERDVNAERTAKATEYSEKHLKDLVKLIERGWTIG